MTDKEVLMNHYSTKYPNITILSIIDISRVTMSGDAYIRYILKYKITSDISDKTFNSHQFFRITEYEKVYQYYAREEKLKRILECGGTK